jgi:hypothetical protein
MERFDQQDDAYNQWREAHPEGYVLNVRTDSPPSLHRASCRVLRPSGSARRGSTTQAPKVCSLNRAELEAWAGATGRRIVPCFNCLERSAKKP